MADFNRALAYVLQQEGGYSDNPNDSGGPTNYGITQAVAQAHGYTGDMQDIDMDTVSSIYQSDYWDNWNLGQIPAQGLATSIFSLHVNMGGGAATVVQAALADLGWTGNQDGAWGPQTLAGVLAADANGLTTAISQEAANYYQDLAARKPKDQEFLAGWLSRAAQLGQLVAENPLTSTGLAILVAVGIGLAIWKTGARA